MERESSAAGRSLSARLALRSEPLSVPLARRRVAALARRRVAEGSLDVLLLLTSEVVSNAVLHAGGRIELCVSIDGQVARVEVRDLSERRPVRREAAPYDLDGRGVRLLDSLSRAWGTHSERRGKSVWFEVPSR